MHSRESQTAPSGTVPTKYINRYNALFGAAYRNAENIIRRLTDTVLAVTDTNYHHIGRDILGLIGVITITNPFVG